MIVGTSHWLKLSNCGERTVPIVGAAVDDVGVEVDQRHLQVGGHLALELDRLLYLFVEYHASAGSC